MANQKTKKQRRDNMSITKPPTIQISTPEESIEISISEDIWKQIPESRRVNKQDLSDFLFDALRIGVLATVNASITIDTQKMESVVEGGIANLKTNQNQALSDLEQLFKDKLIGNNSDLSLQLTQTLGKEGTMANLFNDLKMKLANPETEGSIPAATRQELLDAATQVKSELDQALDITDEKTALGKFIRSQNQVVNNIQSIINTEFLSIKTALGVDEILQQKEAENQRLYQQSSVKGIHFENDAVDALQDIAGLFGDRIEHTGGEGVGKSRTKIGDIVISIISPGVPEIRVSIEVKAGSSITHKELVKQTRDGVKIRGAVCGIGLMEQKHMGKRQYVTMQEGENFIVGVDWDNLNFNALEVVYRMLRIQLIAEEIRSSGEDEIDIDALNRHLTQAKTDLGLFQSMKVGASSAIKTLEELRKNLTIVENKVKDQLTKAENLL